jgi:hypothetical protein
MKLIHYGVLLAGAAFALIVPANGQGTGPIAEGDFPACQPIRIASPDQHWALTTDSLALNCPGQTAVGAQSASAEPAPILLYLRDQRTHRTRRVDVDGWGGHAEWAPDSFAFFVNENVASDEGEASLYRASGLKELDLREAILRNDRSAQRFMNGHSYVRARQWLGDDTALVQLCGHRDEAPEVQFDVRYQVSLDGYVRKVSENTGPPDMKECAWSGTQ